MRRARSRPQRHRGVALALVVWFIAAMALLVAGIVSLGRTDTRLAQIHLARAQSTAAGDGAINLLLADVLEGQFDPLERPMMQARYDVGEATVSVLAVPTAAFVDFNQASAATVSRLLGLLGARERVDARRLTDAIVQWRDASPALGTGSGRFRTLEDVVRVEGMDRTLWDVLRDYAVALPGAVDSTGVGDNAVDGTLAALTAVAPRERARHPQLLAKSPADLGRLRRRGGEYRVDAMLRLGDRVWLRRRWVRTGGSQGGLPWRFLRTEPARIIASVPTAGGAA